jgi:DNA topoisomerase-1
VKELMAHSKLFKKGHVEGYEHEVTIGAVKKEENSSKTKENKEKKEDKSSLYLKKFPGSEDKSKALIKIIEEKIKKEDLKLSKKEENKAIALGTSKINYNDPRITVAWCKTNEVPIEKVFTKALRIKFPWAMYCEPDWKF